LTFPLAKQYPLIMKRFLGSLQRLPSKLPVELAMCRSHSLSLVKDGDGCSFHTTFPE
jgi:hypothetical protein